MQSRVLLWRFRSLIMLPLRRQQQQQGALPCHCSNTRIRLVCPVQDLESHPALAPHTDWATLQIFVHALEVMLPARDTKGTFRADASAGDFMVV